MDNLSKQVTWQGLSINVNPLGAVAEWALGVDRKATYIKIANSVQAGLVLDQLVYMALTDNDRRVQRDGYIWTAIRRYEWRDLTGQTPRQFDRAVDRLIKADLVKKRVYRYNGDPTVHLAVKWGTFVGLWADYTGLCAAPNLPNGESQNTETTAQTPVVQDQQRGDDESCGHNQNNQTMRTNLPTGNNQNNQSKHKNKLIKLKDTCSLSRSRLTATGNRPRLRLTANRARLTATSSPLTVNGLKYLKLKSFKNLSFKILTDLKIIGINNTSLKSCFRTKNVRKQTYILALPTSQKQNRTMPMDKTQITQGSPSGKVLADDLSTIHVCEILHNSPPLEWVFVAPPQSLPVCEILHTSDADDTDTPVPVMPDPPPPADRFLACAQAFGAAAPVSAPVVQVTPPDSLANMPAGGPALDEYFRRLSQERQAQARLQAPPAPPEPQDYRARTLQAIARAQEGATPFPAHVLNANLSFVREQALPMARAFVGRFGRGPLKREIAFWQRTFGEWLEMGLTQNDIEQAMTRMARDGLTVSSPQSVSGIAWNIRNGQNKRTLYNYADTQV